MLPQPSGASQPQHGRPPAAGREAGPKPGRRDRPRALWGVRIRLGSGPALNSQIICYDNNNILLYNNNNNNNNNNNTGGAGGVSDSDRARRSTLGPGIRRLNTAGGRRGPFVGGCGAAAAGTPRRPARRAVCVRDRERERDSQRVSGGDES